MTVGWIAQRLGMGNQGYLNHLLYRQRKSGRKSHYKTRPLPSATQFQRAAPSRVRH